MEKEMHFKESPPSGWHSEENVKAMIDLAPSVIQNIITQSQETNKAEIEAAKVMHRRIALLAGAICIGGVAIAAIAAANGRFETAEKIIIPLISFAGGLGMATRIK